MAKISMDKKYRTREGKPVRILCTDFKGANPVVVAIRWSDTAEVLSMYEEDGTRPKSPLDDLVEVSPKEKPDGLA